nr:reverse transcriptase domain-containing protein [Tanacetum cinerariifolium]
MIHDMEIVALEDYSPASLRNTPSESLNNSYGLVPIASPTLSFFHDDPYIKVMHAYDAIIPPQVPIPSPTIVPPPLMLSPIFNPQEFFVPEELLPPKEQVNYLTSSPTYSSNPSQKQSCILVPPSFSVYTPTPPQIFEIGKIIYGKSFGTHFMISRTAREDHHYEATRLDPILPKRTSTSAAPAMTHTAIRQLVANSVTAALETQDATMANTENTNRNIRPRETPVANKITWTELKRLLTKKYYPRTEVKKKEDEFYNLTVKGNDLKTYVRRFQELAVLCPNVVTNTDKLMEVFIRGLPQCTEGTVTASKPQTLEEATNIAHRLMD